MLIRKKILDQLTYIINMKFIVDNMIVENIGLRNKLVNSTDINSYLCGTIGIKTSADNKNVSAYDIRKWMQYNDIIKIVGYQNVTNNWNSNHSQLKYNLLWSEEKES